MSPFLSATLSAKTMQRSMNRSLNSAEIKNDAPKGFPSPWYEAPQPVPQFVRSFGRRQNGGRQSMERPIPGARRQDGLLAGGLGRLESSHRPFVHPRSAMGARELRRLSQGGRRRSGPGPSATANGGLLPGK